MQQAHRSWRDAPTRTVDVDGARVSYRELGDGPGRPLVALNHLGATLDGWDPRLVDGLARGRRVVALGYRGVGRSTGRTRDNIEGMAADAVAAVRALGLGPVDLFGLSMGGMVAQAAVDLAPGLVHGLVLAGSGPAGGPGLTAMTRTMLATAVRAGAQLRDPRELLFFTRTPTGRRSAREYLRRLRERTDDREPAAGPTVLRAQLAAVHRWGAAEPRATAQPAGPVLVVHGDGDLLVPPANATALTARLPTATLVVHPDSGHGVAFQNHAAVVAAVTDLLRP
ncbi:alpha/beta fold hydrolase [Cellulomonas sp. SLBN-39]|uniref:alpha/beta fold hydrolase n=1 Tax=Cellulomonas sp. SLBN-39 TaxID=2768446 RepID=UPI0011504A2E|nr:alpha/beta hydrolase [Cellulomonas sp. SLBN-39]TQL03958.1 pimeloyl-ACP methyl ester carboxylesterase [Cellulomonas sp. SLBN-39]